MDRNQIIGFSLIAVLFMVYVFFFGPEPQPENTSLIDTTSVAVQPNLVTKTDTVVVMAKPDSLVNKELELKYGVFASGGTGTEEEVVLENKNIQVTLSTKGGNVKKVLLKDYLTYNQKPLYLANETSSEIAKYKGF